MMIINNNNTFELPAFLIIIGISIAIIIDIIVHKRINWYCKSVSLFCPTGSFTHTHSLSLSLSLYVSFRSCLFSSSSSVFNHIYLSVSLTFRTGSFFFSLYVSLRSCSCSCSSRFDRIYPSVLLLCRTVVSLQPCCCLCLCLFLWSCSFRFDRIYLSISFLVSCAIFFSSLYLSFLFLFVFFSVELYLSIRLFIVSS